MQACSSTVHQGTHLRCRASAGSFAPVVEMDPAFNFTDSNTTRCSNTVLVVSSSLSTFIVFVTGSVMIAPSASTRGSWTVQSNRRWSPTAKSTLTSLPAMVAFIPCCALRPAGLMPIALHRKASGARAVCTWMVLSIARGVRCGTSTIYTGDCFRGGGGGGTAVAVDDEEGGTRPQATPSRQQRTVL